jgi:hypothetical protein
MLPDGGFWAQYFRRVNIGTVEGFRQAVYHRLLPPFECIDAEAQAVEQREFERLGQMPAFDDVDMADVAEQASDAGIAFYETMTGVRQALLNIFSASLRHLLEQQLLLFHRRRLLRPTEQNQADLFSLSEALKRLEAYGIDCRRFKTWTKLEELRLVANTVKHAEGPSSKQLYECRPDLFLSPLDRKLKLRPSSGPIFTPLAGEDIYVTLEDLAAYFDAATAFWNELADLLEADST